MTRSLSTDRSHSAVAGLDGDPEPTEPNTSSSVMSVNVQPPNGPSGQFVVKLGTWLPRIQNVTYRAPSCRREAPVILVGWPNALVRAVVPNRLKGRAGRCE